MWRTPETKDNTQFICVYLSHTHLGYKRENKCSGLNASTPLLIPWSKWSSANQSRFVFIVGVVHLFDYVCSLTDGHKMSLFFDAHMHQLGVFFVVDWRCNGLNLLILHVCCWYLHGQGVFSGDISFLSIFQHF